MTISTLEYKAVYLGDGSTVTFPVPYPFFDADDLIVIATVETLPNKPQTVKTLGVDYTVSGGGDATGTVTATIAPPSGVSWTIIRKTDRTQLTDYQSHDPFPAESHEQALDRRAMIDIEQDAILARAIQLPEENTGTYNVILPIEPLRRNKAVIFDDNGNVTVSTDDYEDQAANAAASAAAAAQSAFDAQGFADDAANSATDAAASANAAANSASDAAQSASDAAASASLIPTPNGFADVGKVVAVNPTGDGYDLITPPSSGGSGTGDVVGPLVSTPDAVALYADNTGKVIKNGPSIGTGANQLVQLNATAKLPAVDGSQLTNLPLPPIFVGDSGSGGAPGRVPAPAAGDAAAGKFLSADGSWKDPDGTPPAFTVAATFTTPGDHDFTVPAGKSLVKFILIGAGGGFSYGDVSAANVISTANTLGHFKGGKGGAEHLFGAFYEAEGGGGGASAVFISAVATANAIAVAGGAGGNGMNSGGPIGQGDVINGPNGRGGTPVSGGAGGQSLTNGTAGTQILGGAGANGTTSSTHGGGGGGGGNWCGGGGARDNPPYHRSGGGGANFIHPSALPQFSVNKHGNDADFAAVPGYANFAGVTGKDTSGPGRGGYVEAVFATAPNATYICQVAYPGEGAATDLSKDGGAGMIVVLTA